MKFIGIAALAALAACASSSHAQVPALDHVVVVIMENHSYDQVRLKPYTASLIAISSTCTQSYAVTHPSLPNYLALWAGSTFGIANDNCPADGSPFTAGNLGRHGLPKLGWADWNDAFNLVRWTAKRLDRPATSGGYSM